MENENNEVLDFKITKRHFPRINNDRVLEFVFEKDPNLFMRKNKIIIKGAIEFDRWEYFVENGFVSKLFSMMNVDIDSQTITKSTNR